MTARAIVPLLLLGALAIAGDAPVLAGDDPVPARPAPEADPFLAALAGKSGPDAVAAPDFEPDAEACSWTTRPRREIVDALAARWLRGEAGSWSARSKEWPKLPPPPSRLPADFDPTGVPVTDRLAAWVPADAAAVFFASLKDAEGAVEGLAKFLPSAFPRICDDSRGCRRDAIVRATTMLLLPTIWGANPEVRTGTRQVALVISDPDLRWAPDIAFLAEVDDASLVRSHRLASLRWEERRAAVLRVEGLDAVTDDGAVRSYFALEGGVAVWATSKSLRDRVLAAGATRQPSLLQPEPRAYALARRTFPAAEGGALLVVPDAFLDRASSAEARARRAAALRCEALRMILDARSLSGVGAFPGEARAPSCPSGGVLRRVDRSAGSSCSLHGTALAPGPLCDLPLAGPCPLVPLADVLGSGALPVAARWRGDGMEVLVPPGVPGRDWIDSVTPKVARTDEVVILGIGERERVLTSRFGEGGRVPGLLERLSGTITSDRGIWHTYSLTAGPAPAMRPRGGILRVELTNVSLSYTGGTSDASAQLLLEWR